MDLLHGAGVEFSPIAYASVGAVLVAVAVISFYYLQPNIKDCPTNNERFWRQGGVGFVVSIVAAGLVSIT